MGAGTHSQLSGRAAASVLIGWGLGGGGSGQDVSMCTCGEARGQQQMTSSVAVHVNF